MLYIEYNTGLPSHAVASKITRILLPPYRSDTREPASPGLGINGTGMTLKPGAVREGSSLSTIPGSTRVSHTNVRLCDESERGQNRLKSCHITHNIIYIA
jgi:hypothetical protein